jgi:hypothetical protein
MDLYSLFRNLQLETSPGKRFHTRIAYWPTPVMHHMHACMCRVLLDPKTRVRIRHCPQVCHDDVPLVAPCTVRRTQGRRCLMQRRCLPWCQPNRRAAQVQSGSPGLLSTTMAANAHVRADAFTVTVRRSHFTGLVDLEIILGDCFLHRAAAKLAQKQTLTGCDTCLILRGFPLLL